MVTRLAELEQNHQHRRHSLEEEVRVATRTLLEQQRDLANAERLATVGEVAAGLAHELRNPLAGIHMALSNLRRDLNDREQAARLDLVIDELKRIQGLLNELLEPSRQVPEPLSELCLAEQVKALLDLVRYQVPSHVRLEQVIPADLRCRLPEGRLRQALLNLIINAAQAIGGRPGIITISATLENDSVRIAVCDDGPGFPEALLQTGVRTFISWRDSGTGLGLAMVRRFAQDLGGQLRLSSRIPQGGCATLELPYKDRYG
jgi:signal transduction histidine kinase